MLMTRFDTDGNVEFYCEYCGWVVGTPIVSQGSVYKPTRDLESRELEPDGELIYSCSKCGRYRMELCGSL
jgi:hypothetical protein